MSAECGVCGADLVGDDLQCPECPCRKLVEELAQVDPVMEHAWSCHFCEYVVEGGEPDRAGHAPDCLWRRAKELVG